MHGDHEINLLDAALEPHPALHVACQLAARHQHRAALRAVRAGDHEGWAGLRSGKQDCGAASLGEEDEGG